MWPDRVSNPCPLTCESGVLPTALRGPAHVLSKVLRVIQLNFSGSNTDGSFTMPVSNSSLGPLEKLNRRRFGII